MTAKANALRAQGVDIVSFAAGEPDFNTPEPICRAAIEAIEEGFTKYTPSAGIPALRSAIAQKLERENGVRSSPDQVVVSCGAKHSVYNSMQVLLDPGDEVILIAPYWMTYAEQVRLAGGIPVVVHTEAEHGFQPAYERIREAITDKTKAIILNSPSNPTGAVWPRQTIKEIAALAIRHGFWVVADEIYEKLVYGSEHVSIASLGMEIAERTITINGCSKTFAMTGWRIGYASAPLPVAKAMSNFQDQVTSNPTSFAQKGALAAFTLGDEAIEKMRNEFEIRRDLIVQSLSQIPGVTLALPRGAFYVLPSFKTYVGGRFRTDTELAEYLLEEAHVATVPGSPFEAPGHLRLTYATSREDIERGVSRIAEALARIA
jgi:aspartate aminotransferase